MFTYVHLVDNISGVTCQCSILKYVPSVWKTILCKDKEREKTKVEACSFATKNYRKSTLRENNIGWFDIVADVVAIWIERVQENVCVKVFDKEYFPIL